MACVVMEMLMIMELCESNKLIRDIVSVVIVCDSITLLQHWFSIMSSCYYDMVITCLHLSTWFYGKKMMGLLVTILTHSVYSNDKINVRELQICKYKSCSCNLYIIVIS